MAMVEFMEAIFNFFQPEWFYTQVLNWLRDHEDFLESTIQPIIDRSEFTWQSAQVC